MFHMYDKKIISVTSHALDPRSLCHKLSHFLGPLPLERDVLYGRPLSQRKLLCSRRSAYSLSISSRGDLNLAMNQRRVGIYEVDYLNNIVHHQKHSNKTIHVLTWLPYLGIFRNARKLLCMQLRHSCQSLVYFILKGKGDFL